MMKEYYVSVGDSIGNKEKQAVLKEKYKNYVSFPGMFSFNNTLKFIEQERKGTKRKELRKRITSRNLACQLSRVDQFLQIRQVDVCFLHLPPGFPAVPQYFNHVSVGPMSPHRIAHPYLSRSYHNYRGNNINDYGLKSCIFAEVDDLLLTGSMINPIFISI
jgi:hypothetical protein